MCLLRCSGPAQSSVKSSDLCKMELLKELGELEMMLMLRVNARSKTQNNDQAFDMASDAASSCGSLVDKMAKLSLKTPSTDAPSPADSCLPSSDESQKAPGDLAPSELCPQVESHVQLPQVPDIPNKPLVCKPKESVQPEPKLPTPVRADVPAPSHVPPCPPVESQSLKL